MVLGYSELFSVKPIGMRPMHRHWLGTRRHRLVQQASKSQLGLSWR